MVFVLLFGSCSAQLLDGSCAVQVFIATGYLPSHPPVYSMSIQRDVYSLFLCVACWVFTWCGGWSRCVVLYGLGGGFGVLLISLLCLLARWCVFGRERNLSAWKLSSLCLLLKKWTTGLEMCLSRQPCFLCNQPERSEGR